MSTSHDQLAWLKEGQSKVKDSYYQVLTESYVRRTTRYSLRGF
jgi:hypothetical protein